MIEGWNVEASDGILYMIGDRKRERELITTTAFTTSTWWKLSKGTLLYIPQ